MKIVPVFSILMIAMLNSLVTADDWAHWRGPNQNGISGEKELAETEKPDVTTGDWTMWPGDATRNMVNATTRIDLDFDPTV